VRHLRARLLADSLIAIVLAVVVIRPSNEPAAIAGVVGVATVAVRGRRPVFGCVCMLVSLSLYEALAGSALAVAPAAVVLDYYALGRRTDSGRGRRVTDVVLLVVPIAIIAAGPNGSGFVNVVTPWLFFGVVPFAAGCLVVTHESLTTKLRERVEQLDRVQRDHERLVASVERGRIARELHDVVGHSVSVMVIQAVAARRVAETDRNAACEALRRVAQVGRESLAEIRLLASGSANSTADSSSGMARLQGLDGLVRRASAAGLPVKVEMRGAQFRLPPAIDLAAFRIVQEALTNTIKHAGPATANVQILFEPQALVISVVDDGRGPSSDEDGLPSRHGLLGMRERVAMYGGELRAGGRRGGGFEVVAWLPLGA
jgi:signal transduction histidine kinase